MIALLNGVVAKLDRDSVTVLLSGIGFQVFVAPSVVDNLRIGSEVSLHTSLVVREDSLTLFGFLDEASKDSFIALQTVSGVGPKVALAITNILSAAEVSNAVHNKDVKAFSKAPGVGAKVAQRIILELSGKLASFEVSGEPVKPTHSSVTSLVVDALVGLGYQTRVAEDAVAVVIADRSVPVTQADVPLLLKSSLQLIGKQG